MLQKSPLLPQLLFAFPIDGIQAHSLETGNSTAYQFEAFSPTRGRSVPEGNARPIRPLEEYST
jgi:hypothetical protein